MEGEEGQGCGEKTELKLETTRTEQGANAYRTEDSKRVCAPQ